MNSRKELIREYKETPKEMGVYRIRNTINNRSYVASSKDLQARFNRHRMDLKMGSESVKALLADWVEYGEEAFVFEVLDTLEPLDKPGYDPKEDLKTLESIWFEKTNPYEPNGYNRVKTGR